MTRGGKRAGAGRKPKAPEERPDVVQLGVDLPRDARELLDALQLLLGGSKGEVVAEALRALDREVRTRPEPRKGPSAVVA